MDEDTRGRSDSLSALSRSLARTHGPLHDDGESRLRRTNGFSTTEEVRSWRAHAYYRSRLRHDGRSAEGRGVVRLPRAHVLLLLRRLSRKVQSRSEALLESRRCRANWNSA